MHDHDLIPVYTQQFSKNVGLLLKQQKKTPWRFFPDAITPPGWCIYLGVGLLCLYTSIDDALAKACTGAFLGWGLGCACLWHSITCAKREGSLVREK